MSLDKKIISEIQRYKNINKYITEQALDAAAPPADPAADLGAMAPPPPADPAAAAPPAAPTPTAATAPAPGLEP